jgi:F0F1-type ATP synthase membrane subunit b/b'
MSDRIRFEPEPWARDEAKARKATVDDAIGETLEQVKSRLLKWLDEAERSNLEALKALHEANIELGKLQRENERLREAAAVREIEDLKSTWLRGQPEGLEIAVLEALGAMNTHRDVAPSDRAQRFADELDSEAQEVRE